MNPPAMLTAILKSQALLIAAAITAFLIGWSFGLPVEKEAESSSASEEVWTCSMHPQIRQPNPGTCPICAMDLIPLEAGSGGGHREVGVTSEAAALLDLRVSPVIRQAAEANVQLFGRIAYDERRLSNITARMSGRLDRLFVDFTGTRIRTGDHLAEIYSPDLYVAQRELIEAARGLRELESGASAASRRTRESIYNGAREKLRLLQLTDEQIANIEKQKEPSDHITLNSTRDGIVISKMASEGQYVNTGDALVGIADLSTVWLNLEAYESDLVWLRYAQDVEFTVEALPGLRFHGRIAFIAPDINPQTRVTNVRVNVPNPDLQLKPGMFAKAEIKSLIGAGNQTLDPSLAGKWISPMHPEVVSDEPGQCTICGMDLVPASELGFVGRATVERARLPLLVPASAVLHTGERAVVYVRLSAIPDPKFEGREIVLGPRVGRHYIVRSGLSEGEMVVTRGAFKLDSELQIKAKPSMMNRDAGFPEAPAIQAEDSLLGQWAPVPRALGRLSQAVVRGDTAAARLAIEEMEAAIDHVSTELLSPETLGDWREFSNRLKNTLTLAHTEEAQLEITFRNIRLAVEEAGRFLGLPYQPVIVSGEVSEEKLTLLQSALDAYYRLAEMLARDDFAAAQSARDALAAILPGLDIPADSLTGARDMASLRQAFEPVSNALISRVREMGTDRVGNAYVIHCPMAFDDAGADWISPIAEVHNPYFGAEMLSCGSIREKLSFERDANKPGPPPSSRQPQTSPSPDPDHDHE